MKDVKEYLGYVVRLRRIRSGSPGCPDPSYPSQFLVFIDDVLVGHLCYLPHGDVAKYWQFTTILPSGRLYTCWSDSKFSAVNKFIYYHLLSDRRSKDVT